MRYPQLDKLANILVTYSVAVKPGDLVRIRGAVVTEPLLTAIYREVIRAGGHPIIRMTPDECEEIALTTASDEQLKFVNPLAQHEIETIDCSIGVWGSSNTKALSQIDPARQALASQATKTNVDTFLKRAAEGALRWVGTEFPTHASAQDAEMSLANYEAFVFHAGKLNEDDPAAAWRKVQESQQRVCDFMEKAHTIRCVTPQGTDITLSIAGRRWINCCGRRNFPDGEVYTGPIEDATNGIVKYSYPAVHDGREVDGVCLEFKAGRVVNASATKGEEFLIAMLDQDPGARILGEIGIGTNYSIQRFSRNMLFDEKIGGTFHLAVGSSYPQSGGKNESALHWDMVCDLRQGGRMEVDGKLVSENGIFLDPLWPHP